MKTKLTAADIELAISRRRFDFRMYLIVPRISWGMHMHECDLLVMTAAGYCHEIEIKVSVSDMKADLKKLHHHEDQRIKYLWYAFPKVLGIKIEPLVPEHAGIMTVDESGWVKIERTPQARKGARPLEANEREKLMRLAAMRYWLVRRSTHKDKKTIKELRQKIKNAG